MRQPRRLRTPAQRRAVRDELQTPRDLLPPPGEIGAGIALVGLLAFVVCYSYERAFYATFTVSPDDVGQGYAVILSKAATGAALLAALAAPTGLSPWLLHWLRRRSTLRRRPATAVAFIVTSAVTASYAAGLGVLADLPALTSAATGLTLGLIGCLAFLTSTGAHHVARTAGPSSRTAWVVAGAAVYGLVIVGASRAGTADSLALLKMPYASPTVSTMQTLLAMQTPAATVTWTPPGTVAPQTTIARVIGSVGDALLVYDLNSCTLRRLSGDVTVASRLVATTPEPVDRRGSPLPVCPRSR